MNFTKITETFPSTNRVDTITYYVYLPEEKPRGIIQISHGMCEYIARYEDFADFLTSKGFIVVGNDHLGHGKSVSADEKLGYFAEKNGWLYLVKDLHKLTRIVKQKYPDLPYFLLGHSMGSFAARVYIAHYGYELDGVLLLGTGDGLALSSVGTRVARSVVRAKGEFFRSKRLNQMVFGMYNDRIKNHKTDYDWVTSDIEHIEKYANDNLCNFIFTASGFVDLTAMLEYISRNRWAQAVPKNLPILLAAGTGDPVGSYGKGVMRVYDKLIDNQCSVDIKLYPNARHELINETIRADVYEDLLWWIEKVMKRI